MTQFINDFTAKLTPGFYILQVLTIIALLAYGLLLIAIIRKGKISLSDMLLAFPISLAAYSVAGYFLLSFGIPFNKYSVIVLMLLFAALSYFLFMRNIRWWKAGPDLNKKSIIAAVIVFIILALISTSGILPVSATNDSMYFFREYPRALIHYGKLVSYLDNFLTDASQGISIIGTIPFFYGFDEIYGILTFLNIDFILIFTYAAYELCMSGVKFISIRKGENVLNTSGTPDEKKAYIMAALAFLMLVSSMPFIIMSRWFMANMFFMEFMFIVVYFAYKYEENADYADMIILSLLITGLSIMRMEGALTAGFFVLCIMMLDYRNRDIALFLVCPMLVLQSMYLYRIFRILTLHTGYQFMTEEKALILIAFLLVILFYALVIRGRVFVKIQKYYSLLLLGGFILLNIVVLLYDRADYMTNMRAFIGNVTGASGWGLFASFVIGILILVPKKSFRLNYFDLTMICYVLLTIVTGWARGDTLYVSFGDSGNRILIQAVPLILFTLIIKIMEGIRYWKKENSDLME